MQWVTLIEKVQYEDVSASQVLCSPSTDDETADLETTLGILEKGGRQRRVGDGVWTPVTTRDVCL